MCISLKRMSSENKSITGSRRQRRSLLDHIVDSVANMAPELERETSASFSTSTSKPNASTTSTGATSLRQETIATKAKSDSQQNHNNDNDTADNSNMSSLTSSIKHIELQDLRAEQVSSSFISTTSTTNSTSSFSSSWATTRSHLIVAEEIVSHLESEVMQQECISYETQKDDVHDDEISKAEQTDETSPSCPTRHDPFSKDSNFAVGEDGLITLSSLLSDDDEAGTGSSSFSKSKRSWMNRAA